MRFRSTGDVRPPRELEYLLSGNPGSKWFEREIDVAISNCFITYNSVRVIMEPVPERETFMDNADLLFMEPVWVARAGREENAETRLMPCLSPLSPR